MKILLLRVFITENLKSCETYVKTCKAEHLNESNIKLISKVTSKLILLGGDVCYLQGCKLGELG